MRGLRWWVSLAISTALAGGWIAASLWIRSRVAGVKIVVSEEHLAGVEADALRRGARRDENGVLWSARRR